MTAQLTFVGCGYRKNQLTLEVLEALRRAAKVYYYCAYTGEMVKKLFPAAVDVFEVTEGNAADRRHRYEQIISLLIREASKAPTAAVFYGSSALAVCIANAAVIRAREHGISAQILPGVSCFESLICDLAGHPKAPRQTYDHGAVTAATATSFLLHPTRFSIWIPLVLLAPNVVGTFGDDHLNPQGLKVLAGALAQRYGRYHDIILYSAGEVPLIRTIPICRLPDVEMHPTRWTAVTLYIPPIENTPEALEQAFVAGARFAARKISERQQIERQFLMAARGILKGSREILSTQAHPSTHSPALSRSHRNESGFQAMLGCV